MAHFFSWLRESVRRSVVDGMGQALDDLDTAAEDAEPEGDVLRLPFYAPPQREGKGTATGRRRNGHPASWSRPQRPRAYGQSIWPKRNRCPGPARLVPLQPVRASGAAFANPGLAGTAANGASGFGPRTVYRSSCRLRGRRASLTSGASNNDRSPSFVGIDGADCPYEGISLGRRRCTAQNMEAIGTCHNRISVSARSSTMTKTLSTSGGAGVTTSLARSHFG
jgi:hypothetical protein